MPHKTHAVWVPETDFTDYAEDPEDDELMFTVCGHLATKLPVTKDPSTVTCGNCKRIQQVSSHEIRMMQAARKIAYSKATSQLRELYRNQFEELFRELWVEEVNAATNSNHRDLDEILFDILGYPA